MMGGTTKPLKVTMDFPQQGVTGSTNPFKRPADWPERREAETDKDIEEGLEKEAEVTIVEREGEKREIKAEPRDRRQHQEPRTLTV
ncbi:hypothetical protein NDU88_001919 [Pleurodeles waltl]|uniref:Uncharacterized protein n=1 Tax=Pleurodeles waltl TaxID=8319 RepID=A0AAV7P5D3_PLEWA|nr:hypothetical protein NDU88_001919 [Pleurodeles waltl]